MVAVLFFIDIELNHHLLLLFFFSSSCY